MMTALILAAVVSATPADVPSPRDWHLNRGDYQSNGVWYAQEPQPPQPPLPAQFPDGVAVPLPNRQWVLIEPIADGEPPVTLVISHSPIGADWQELRRQGRAKYAEKKAAAEAEAAALKEKLAAVEAKATVAETKLQAVELDVAKAKADIVGIKDTKNPAAE